MSVSTPRLTVVPFEIAGRTYWQKDKLHDPDAVVLTKAMIDGWVKDIDSVRAPPMRSSRGHPALSDRGARPAIAGHTLSGQEGRAPGPAPPGCLPRRLSLRRRRRGRGQGDVEVQGRQRWR